jgi:AraC-like DNA-binding protein
MSHVDSARRSITVTRPRKDEVEPTDRRVSAQLADSVSAKVVVKLLNSAQQALSSDRAQVGQLIGRVTAIISAEAEDSRSIASKCYLAPWQTRRVIEFVEANLSGTIKIQDLAGLTRLSASYFSKAFSSDFGKSPYAYVVRRRIERAQEMMLLTNEPLASIALACGLADQSHLTRLFHRIIGVTPASWRRLRAARCDERARAWSGGSVRRPSRRP